MMPDIYSARNLTGYLPKLSMKTWLNLQVFRKMR